MKMTLHHHHQELNVSNISAVTNSILTKLLRYVSGINKNNMNNNNNFLELWHNWNWPSVWIFKDPLNIISKVINPAIWCQSTIFRTNFGSEPKNIYHMVL